MAATLVCDSFVFDPRPDYQFRLAIKRYRDLNNNHTDDDALTLVFAHCVGGHKEQWEPTLEHLYDFVSREPNLKIREAWCIDAPDHGDSSIFNDHLLTSALDWRPESSLGWEDYARSIHAFLSGLGSGIDVDFRSRKLVAVGHSLGAVAFVLSTPYLPKVKFLSMILIEPMIIRKPKPGEFKMEYSEIIAKRRDIWPSREEAMRFFTSEKQWQGWDPRSFQIYADHGLRDLPTETYPNLTQGVTLKCTKRQEAALYRDRLCSLRAFQYLHVLCQRIPVHLIHGEHADFIPRYFQEDILKVATRGHQATSSKVPGGGHMVVHTHPEETDKRARL
ncbi:uncharacterized protein PHACADRAFT_211609 [Phanerochaete carnosa HHB-10118-sp]|uniref:AB hydrolase-1 domain-containing protein n=1 Tax=Phanerochaete carnosa (strain HHB-10118-sp) TaxID=650164 RepID=K5W0F7_PHACS|nr:uncharacterized protein PHACADRAFT_211609 [Phanerochaete carnosa HHB-10118-sp]EKM52339.1 hypothetical protein PHACADRAFT_211609 [Phanerochaete carnosa HHB-10118-sp]